MPLSPSETREVTEALNQMFPAVQVTAILKCLNTTQTSGATSMATVATPGGIKKGAAVANCTVSADATSAGTQLNLLLAQLRAGGVIS